MSVIVLITPLVLTFDTVMLSPDRISCPFEMSHARWGSLSLMAVHVRINSLPATTGLLAEAVIFRVCSNSVCMHVYR